jgi:nucleotide-binding universal stress UspA family protein
VFKVYYLKNNAMTQLKKVLIPIDFSPVAANAVKYASSILDKHEADLVLVYVNTPEHPKSEQDIANEFEAFEKEVLQNVSFVYTLVVLNGPLLQQLTNETSKQKADLVIMGSKGKRDTDLSLASALIRSVVCPVIVIPGHYTNHQIHKIAFANDFKPIRESDAIKPLWQMALEFKAKVYMLHINFSKEEALVPADAAESTLEYFFEDLQREYVNLSGDDMEVAISNYIKENEIDVLAILSRDHGDNQLKSEGRLIAQLTAHADVPILVLC